MTVRDREREVGRAFVALADTLVDDYDIIDLLDRLVGHCVHLLTADAAAIMLGDPHGKLRVAAASSEDAQLMDLLQLQTDEGPSLDCYRTTAPVHVEDLTTATRRWPRFIAAATTAGTSFASTHAIPLRLRGQAIGTLHLLYKRRGPLVRDDLDLGQALADVATIGILSERAIRRSEVLAEQLQATLNSRVMIEQAKGVLAYRLGVDVHEAFNRLLRYAREFDEPLVDVACRAVGGDLDLRLLTAPSKPGHLD